MDGIMLPVRHSLSFLAFQRPVLSFSIFFRDGTRSTWRPKAGSGPNLKEKGKVKKKDSNCGQFILLWSPTNI